MRRIKARQGFTLVELSLSLVFIGILSLTVALIINNAVSSYRRGVTLNQVNTVGMELVDDIRGALQASPPDRDELCGGDEGCTRVLVQYSAKVLVGDTIERDIPVYGAICTGKYSYIWRSGYLSSGQVDDRLPRYIVNSEKDFRLAKIDDSISDSKRTTICSDKSRRVFELPEGANLEILLAEDEDNPLALYDFVVQEPAVGPKGDTAYYTASFILGTVQGGININATGDFCKAPKDGGGAFDYCAINKFNFAAQATGGKSVEKK